ncbi:hypothetical protein EDD85DRAFT_211862 [Armillaria nabsnona]|nr:hypothetical protein EDD85DRAFT_211862 [Armillaria nabsnona]
MVTLSACLHPCPVIASRLLGFYIGNCCALTGYFPSVIASRLLSSFISQTGPLKSPHEPLPESIIFPNDIHLPNASYIPSIIATCLVLTYPDFGRILTTQNPLRHYTTY